MTEAEAWVRRDIERRNVLDRLQKHFFNLDDKLNPHSDTAEKADAPFLAVATLCLAEAARRRGDSLSAESLEELKKFLKEACEEIDKFARSPEEAQKLIAELSGKFLVSGLSSFHANLQRQEMEDPKRIFHAASAMSEVDLPSE